MQEVFDINTGEVLVSSQGSILRAQALGSCIAVVAYEPDFKVGGIAHIMLPGHASSSEIYPYRYCENAIDHLENLVKLTSGLERLSGVCLVGAGNVLHDIEDTICPNNINSVCSYLKIKDINILASVLGGFSRKSVFLDLVSGKVEYSVKGSSKKMLLDASKWI